MLTSTTRSPSCRRPSRTTRLSVSWGIPARPPSARMTRSTVTSLLAALRGSTTTFTTPRIWPPERADHPAAMPAFPEQEAERAHREALDAASQARQDRIRSLLSARVMKAYLKVREPTARYTLSGGCLQGSLVQTDGT